jgi:hypothetical protein
MQLERGRGQGALAGQRRHGRVDRVVGRWNGEAWLHASKYNIGVAEDIVAGDGNRRPADGI